MDRLLIQFAESAKDSEPVRAFFRKVKEKRDGALFSATQKGDTEFEKGKYEAYREIYDMPKDILNQTQEADTVETVS